MSVDLAFDDLTGDSRAIIARATEHALRRRATTIEPQHLLVGLLDSKNRLLQKVLNALKIDTGFLRQAALVALPPETPVSPSLAAAYLTPLETPRLSAQGQEVIHAAAKEASLLGHYRIDALHLLLGMLYNTEQAAFGVLTGSGLSLAELRGRALRLGSSFRTRPRHDLRAAVRPSPIFLLLLATLIGSGAMLGPVPRTRWLGRSRPSLSSRAGSSPFVSTSSAMRSRRTSAATPRWPTRAT